MTMLADSARRKYCSGSRPNLAHLAPVLCVSAQSGPCPAVDLADDVGIAVAVGGAAAAVAAAGSCCLVRCGTAQCAN